MGPPCPAGEIPADPVSAMDGKEVQGIPPYRMGGIMKTASEVMALLVGGKHLYSPTYRECKIVVELVMEAIQKSENENRRE